ncbi:glycosyltransferase [Aliiglaciecola lipolytica]|uniref:glycosyltransferase n=1 Tax=Aliiglaciecola lipolytica TaxID=477689 RepID=UPI001C083259|nr:glycosyltransferase [Aliiglaciecola lipolytica]MBU2877829.1 glycosyltransferase [Aliiglaciecola lipolytica]
MEIITPSATKILFDLAATHPGALGSMHGGGVYAEVVFEKLASLVEQNTLDVFYFAHKKIAPNILALCQQYGIVEHKINTRSDIQTLIDTGKYHTLYSALPYENFTETDTQNIRFLYTIHGLRELEAPYSVQQWRYSLHWKRIVEWLFAMCFTQLYLKRTKNRFKELLQKPNSQIITISEHSKYSILQQFGDIVSAEDLTKLYSPLLDGKANTQTQETSQNTFKYFLLINGNRWIKNSYRALKALKCFYASNPECDVKTLVLGLDKPPTEFAHDDHFIFKGYVSRDELESAFAKAYAFIYPSLNEGFGYPPLEAMKHGTPVLASAVSAIPEVCGDAVLYFNPYNESEIANRIAEVYFDNNKRNDLIARGHRRFEEITTSQTDMLLTLCHMIMQKSG